MTNGTRELATLQHQTGSALIHEPRQISTFSIRDVKEMAEEVAQARMFPGITTAAQAFTLMMLCQADNLHPMKALMRYHIIEDRPSMKSEVMLAEFQTQGGRFKHIESNRVICSMEFWHPVLHPDHVMVTKTMEEFIESGLTMTTTREGRTFTKKNWKQSPAQMLLARCITQGVNMILPGVKCGIYSPEETRDIIDDERAQLRGPAVEQPVIQIETKGTQVPIPNSKEAVNKVFSQAPSKAPQAIAERPEHDKEETKFPGDKIDRSGFDKRKWVDLVTEEVGRVVDEIEAEYREHNLEPVEPTSLIRVTRHMIARAREDGDTQTPEPIDEKTGKVKRANIGVLGAHLVKLYAVPAWREWVRSALRLYLEEKRAKHLGEIRNHVYGDEPGPDEQANQEPAEKPEEASQAVPAENDPEVWTPGRE